MRVGLVILHARPSRGGAERYTHDLAAALAAGGHEVSLLATSFEEVPVGVRKIELERGGATRVGRYRGMLRALEEKTGRGEFDVVHAMLPVRRCDVYHPHAGLAVEAVGGMDWLVNPRRAMFARVERELLNGATRPVVLCLSEVVRAGVRRWYPELPEAGMATLFNAVDLARFDPGRGDVKAWRRENIAEGAAIFAMVAQDFERKGVGTAIAALARLGGDLRPWLVIAGGDEAGKYRRLARSLGVGERVVFVGHMEDVRELYRAAWAVVMPTRQDPCSLVVLEALAMGVPVISTRANGACEIMTDGMEGYVMERAEDVEGLAERMGKVLEPGRRAAMAGAALGLRPRLAFENHVRALVEVYRGRLARNG